MSLLDDVSIVVTPNGYKAGELYAVIPVPTEGAEEIDDGSFANDLDDWSKYGVTSATGGIATIGASANSGIFQNILTEGVRYTVTINVVSVNATGTSEVTNGNGNNLYTITETGIQTFIFTSAIASGQIILRGMSNALFSVSSVSVKEYTSADMDVTRATDATRVDENGLIADVLSGVPRIDYTGGGCPHILAEPQRTNLVTYSEVYGSGTFFSGTSGSVIDNTTSISPSGDANATQVTSTGAGKIQSGGLGLTINTDYTLSFYAKNVDATAVTSRVLATGGSGGSNLTSVSYISELSTTEWTKITHSFNTGTNTTIYVYISNVLNSGGTIQLWGAQLEEGSYATSYIPTSGSTVTRNQDIFTRDGIGSLINSVEGTFFAEISKPITSLDNHSIISLNNATSNSDSNSLAIGFDSGQDFYIRLRANGSSIFTDNNRASSSNTFYKIAVAYKSGASLIYVDGIPITPVQGSLTDVFSFSETLDNLSFDYNGNNVLPFYGNVRQLQVYKTALTDTQLAALTS